MSQILSIVNYKDGTGKTTSAVNLAVSFALLEKRTLLVDCDPVGDAGKLLRVDTERQLTLFDLMVKKNTGNDCNVKTNFDMLDFIASDLNLLSIKKQLSLKPFKERILRASVIDLKKDYDYIILDIPSLFGFITYSVYVASDWLFLPVDLRSQYPDEVLFNQVKIISDIKKKFNLSLKIGGVFFTRCDSKQIKTFSAKNELNAMPFNLFLTQIPESNPDFLNSPVALKDLKSKEAVAYLKLASELILFFNK